MLYAGVGYPATVSSGFTKAVPTYSKAVAPYGKAGGFAKPGVAGFGKPFAGVGKAGVGKPFAGGGVGKAGVGYPATKAGGFSTAVPATTVATTPFPGAFGGVI